MKSTGLCFLAIGLGLSLQCKCQGQSSNTSAARGQVLAKIHFAGFNEGTTNATTFREVWNLPESNELREQAKQKIARHLAQTFSPGAAADTTALLNPLLDDLWRRESYLEVRAQTNGGIGWRLAVQLDVDRARLWQTNWKQWSSRWDPKRAVATSELISNKSNSWFIINSGSTAPSKEDEYYRRIRSEGRPVAAVQDQLLKLEADLARLGPALGLSNSNSLPAVDLAVMGKGSALRSQSRLLFPQNQRWPIEPWQIPTNTIRDPADSLISFTAIQGFAPWISRHPLINDLGIKPAPNQLYLWGQVHAPFQVLAALRVPDITNVIQKMVSQFIPRANSNLVHHGVGEIQAPTNRTQIIWTGLPFLLPYLRPAPEPKGNFALAGIFPVAADTNPPPAGLLSQLTSRTNLLYYDWEVTQGRLAQLRQIAQTMAMFTTLHETDTNSLSSRWLDAVGPKLGNTITEISVASPRELNFVRNSHIGLNGLELVALAYWVESAHFPKLDYHITFPPPKPPRKK